MLFDFGAERGHHGGRLERYGDKSEIEIAQHHWPIWGKERIVSFLKKQRDLYKFIHDQSVRLLNHGLTPTEISEQLKLPPALASDWASRGYYGTLSHNAKAVYQFYLGWYDANPADLNPLPRAEEAKKQVEYMGGASAVIRRARDDFKAGQYRWVARVTSQLVFADPSNTEARELGADALEQLGYQMMQPGATSASCARIAQRGRATPPATSIERNVRVPVLARRAADASDVDGRDPK